MDIKVFIQARMSSSRFPGKVLAPVSGQPMISRVVGCVARSFDSNSIVVATSEEISDDPLVFYVESLGVKVFRGPLDDVFGRFRLCLAANPCDWFFRINADSPLLNGNILAMMLPYINPSIDLITNAQKRTFPHGQGVELLNVSSFIKIDPNRLSADEHEHVTKFYYAHSDEFQILNFENTDNEYSSLNFVVDKLDDLPGVEEMLISKYGNKDFIPSYKVGKGNK